MGIPPIHNTSSLYHWAHILWEGDRHIIAPDVHDEK